MVICVRTCILYPAGSDAKGYTQQTLSYQKDWIRTGRPNPVFRYKIGDHFIINAL